MVPGPSNDAAAQAAEFKARMMELTQMIRSGLCEWREGVVEGERKEFFRGKVRTPAPAWIGLIPTGMDPKSPPFERPLSTRVDDCITEWFRVKRGELLLFFLSFVLFLEPCFSSPLRQLETPHPPCSPSSLSLYVCRIG